MAKEPASKAEQVISINFRARLCTTSGTDYRATLQQSTEEISAIVGIDEARKLSEDIARAVGDITS